MTKEVYKMQNYNNRRITAWIAALAILLVMHFSTIYISQHINHDCSGSECPVCAVMEQCATNLKNIVSFTAILAVGLLICLSMKKELQLVNTEFFSKSLISQNVRMNN